MRRLFLHNIIFAIIANLLIKPAWVFLVDKQVQVIVGHEQFGHYAALLNLSIIFNYLLDLGLTHYYNVAAAANIEKTRSLYLPIIKAKFLLLIPYIIIVVIAARFFSLSVSPLLIYVLVLQFFISLLAFTRAGINSLQFYKIDSLFSILDKLLVISFIGFGGGFYVFKGSLENYVIVQILALVLVNCIGLYFLLKHSNAGAKIAIKEIFKNAAPFALIVFLMAIYSRLDIILLKKLHLQGAYQAGVYAYCYRFLDVANMIGFLFAGLLLSLFARFKDDRAKIRQLIHYSAYILIPASVIIACVAYHYSNDILKATGPYNDALHNVTFQNVMLGFPALCITHIYCTWLTSSLRLTYLIQLTLAVVILTYIGIILILPGGDASVIALWSSIVFYIAGIGYVVKAYISDAEIHPKPFFYLIGICVLIIVMNFALAYFEIGIITDLICNALAYLAILGMYYRNHRSQIEQYL